MNNGASIVREQNQARARFALYMYEKRLESMNKGKGDWKVRMRFRMD